MTKGNYLFVIFAFLIKIGLINLITINNLRNLNKNISEIHLIINGTGNQQILYGQFMTSPSEVIVNEISKGNLCLRTCDLDLEINNVIIKFNEQLKSCYYMFYELENIIEIDLSYFDASQVKTFGMMFSDCKNLEKINFGNINTSSIENMKNLFCGCSKLISIDLSKFNTSKVNDMSLMFISCTNLKYLDLSNFDTSNVIDMRNMFNKCGSLIYLNLKSFVMNNSVNFDSIFKKISRYIKVCAEDEKLKDILSESVINSSCSDLCFKKDIKLDIINNSCIESCLINGYKYELNNICYHECPEGSFLLFEDELDNHYESVKKCYDKTPEEYYLDIKNKTYKRCYKNCKYCYGEGNETINNCIECNDNLTLIDDSLYNTNCYEKCNFYYYFDENNDFHCTEICPEKYNKIIKEKNECIEEYKNNDTYEYYDESTYYTSKIKSQLIINESADIINEEIIDIITQLIRIDNTDKITNEIIDFKSQLIKNENKDIINYENILSLIQNFLLINNIRNNDTINPEMQDKIQEKIKDLIKYEFNIININDGDDIILNVGGVNYTITTTKNQKRNYNNYLSKINLRECEDKLKEEYNISKNDSLYILKIDLIIEQIHKVEYEVYYPLLPYNLTILNLSVCKDIKIDISIPFVIPKGQIKKYNKSSELYNSICYTSTSEHGTDEPYKDRQDNYKKNNSLKVCEEDCDFSEYDYNNKIALCSCFTKIKLPAISAIKIDKEKMFYNFKNINNIANFKMLECINLFFDKKNIFKNSSNYMMMLLLILSAVSLFCLFSMIIY